MTACSSRGKPMNRSRTTAADTPSTSRQMLSISASASAAVDEVAMRTPLLGFSAVVPATICLGR